MATILAISACSAAGTGDGPGTGSSASGDGELSDWESVVEQAQGQEVSLWMWGGDDAGNAYVDDVLAPAAAAEGVTLRRVPVADTQDALNRVLSELQAGRRDDGSVDLVWVNGENFRSGQQAEAWRCGWTSILPSMRYVDLGDPLLTEDFGTPVDGCEAPWHRAQFVFAYDSADVEEPPTTTAALMDWVRDNPGRFTYPAPPDFTGSVFLRQVLNAVAGGHEQIPDAPDDPNAEQLTAELWDELSELAPSLWRGGDTYPRDLGQLEELFAGDQVSFTMTYGPATLDALVADGTLPDTTRVLPLEDGTVGNASFLAIPANAASAAGAMVVADLALSPEQQLAKADPAVWGQYTVLDLERLPANIAAGFDALPASTVVPPFEELSANALPELRVDWVDALEDGWRAEVLAR